MPVGSRGHNAANVLWNAVVGVTTELVVKTEEQDLEIKTLYNWQGHSGRPRGQWCSGKLLSLLPDTAIV